MTIVQITSLRVDERRCSEEDEDCVPFLRVNLTFKVPQEEEEYLHCRFKGATEDYQKVISIADPEKHHRDTLESFFRKTGPREALRIIPQITDFWSRTLTSTEDSVWSRSYRGDFWRSLNWGWLEDGQNSERSKFDVEGDEDDCELVSFMQPYFGKPRAKPKFTWTYAEPHLVYLEKFDTFWYRDYISDCSVTRAALDEISYYKDNQKFRDVYRFIDGSILYKHIATLNRYWD
jgi:hypothetical protein